LEPRVNDLPFFVMINPDQTKAFVAINKIGSMTMSVALSTKLSWKVIEFEDIPENCQVYSIIRHPFSKLASSLAQEWAAQSDWPTPYQLKFFRRILDNDFEWMLDVSTEFTAPQHPIFDLFPGIKLVRFEDFNKIWGHLGISNPGLQLNDSRGNGFQGTAKVLMERAAMEHESVVLDKYAQDLVIWEETKSVPQRFEDATGIS